MTTRLRAVLVLLVVLGTSCAGAATTGTTTPGALGGGSATTKKDPCKPASTATPTTAPVASDCQPLVPIRQFIDNPANPGLPPYFRNFSQAAANPPANINTTGLAGLPVSGSANPTASQWAQIKSLLGPQTIVVDLRAESHAILNGDVVAWFAANAGVGDNDANKGRSPQEIEQNESALIARTQATPTLGLDSEQPPTTSTTVQVQSVLSEQQSVHANGLQYQRLYFQDGKALTDRDVAELIDLYRNLQPGQQLMLHCNNGWDRTTQALTVLDIINNAPTVSLQDIAARQEALSQVFNKVLDDKRGPLMQRVYDWASANPGGSGASWAAYAKANPKPTSQHGGTTQTTT